METEKKYVITDGSKFILMNQFNEQVTTTDKQLAQTFTYDKANNMMKNIKKTLQMFSWNIVEVKTQNVEQQEDNFTYRQTLFESDSFNWDKEINQLQNFENDMSQYKLNLHDKQIENEAEICDIYHYIEFMKLNAAQLCKASMMLKERLKIRRHIKDELKRILYVESSSKESIKHGDLKRAFDGLEHRKYEPRVLKELFNV